MEQAKPTYWAIDKDGYEYLTDDPNNHELLQPDGRQLDKEKCPRIFQQFNRYAT